jgi:hypothetical protein
MIVCQLSNQHVKHINIVQVKDLPHIGKKRPIPHYRNAVSWTIHTILFALYAIGNLIFTVIQKHIIWRYNGTLQQLYDSYKPENYERSAQVLRIVFTYRYDVILQPLSMVDFYLVHEKFDHPERVLRDNVDMYFVDENKAVFTEAEEGVQQWKNDYHVHLRVAQYQQAVRVIILPMHAATRLSEKIGDPKAKLIFLSNTARCGGTLLGQVYERTGKCVVFSEPGGLQNLAMMEQNKMPHEKLDKITRIVIRLFCKPVKNPKEVVAYVFKPIAGTLDTVPAIQRVYPKAKHLFCYRDVKSMANAIQKLRNTNALIRIMWWGGSKSAFLMSQALKTAGLSTNLTLKLEHPMDLGFVTWGASVRQYLDMRNQGVDIAGFFYDDLLKDKRYAVEKAFEFTGMPADLVDAGVRGLDKDSQGDSGISSKDFVPYIDYKLVDDPYLIDLGNRVAAMFGLPKVEGDVRVEGTISTAPPK